MIFRQTKSTPLSVFGIPALQAVLQYKWETWARLYLLIEFCIFLLWLISFVAFSIFLTVQYNISFQLKCNYLHSMILCLILKKKKMTKQIKGAFLMLAIKLRIISEIQRQVKIETIPITCIVSIYSLCYSCFPSFSLNCQLYSITSIDK